MSNPTKPRRTRAPSQPKAPLITYDQAEALFCAALYEREKVRALANDESAAPVFRKIAQGELPAATERADNARRLCEILAPTDTGATK